MYGMVNQAIEEMVVELQGEATWERVRARAGAGREPFVRMQAYADELTFGLVSAAVEELQTPGDELLRSLGTYWVSFAQRSGYAAFFKASPDYASFLAQLDAMHVRLQLSFPQLVAPEFSCAALDGSRLEVLYRSRRRGLAPFVLGLLEGLGPVFGVDVRVAQRSSGSDARGVVETFEVTLAAR